MKRVLGDSRLSSKCQVTVPKSARELLELGTGDMLIFVVEGDSVLLKKGRLLIEGWRQ